MTQQLKPKKKVFKVKCPECGSTEIRLAMEESIYYPIFGKTEDGTFMAVDGDPDHGSTDGHRLICTHCDYTLPDLVQYDYGYTDRYEVVDEPDPATEALTNALADAVKDL